VIGIVDLCYRKDSLSAYEFVAPIVRIVERKGLPCAVTHHSELGAGGPAGADGVILCGTALKDDRYIRHADAFGWLAAGEVPVLGICAGMQVIATVFGGELERGSEIGMTEVRVVKADPLFSGMDGFMAYELHNRAVRPPGCFDVLAVSADCIQAMRHASLQVYGVMFHPEVRNEWVVERFVQACTGRGNSAV